MSLSNIQPSPTTFHASPSAATILTTTNEPAPEGITIVVPLGLTLLNISALCTFYVLFRAIRRWWYTRESLPMAWRVPFYIAISEVLLWVVHLPNLVYPAIYGHPWPEPSCQVIGGITFFFIAINILLVGLIAVTTYCRIVQRMRIDYGYFDYKFFSVIITISAIFTLIGIPSFGASKFWCFTTKDHPIIPVLTLSLNFSVLLLTFLAYTLTLREVNSVRVKDEELSDQGARQRVRIENVVTRKIITYELCFLVQWTPSMIYVIGQIIGYDAVWTYVVTDLTINIGGIVNFIQFTINEGWYSNDHKTLFAPKRSQMEPRNIEKRDMDSDETIVVDPE